MALMPHGCDEPHAKMIWWPGALSAYPGRHLPGSQLRPWTGPHGGTIQFSIFPRLPGPSTPSLLAGAGPEGPGPTQSRQGWDGWEKHSLGTPPAFTPTLARPRLRGREKTDRSGSKNSMTLAAREILLPRAFVGFAARRPLHKCTLKSLMDSERAAEPIRALPLPMSSENVAEQRCTEVVPE